MFSVPLIPPMPNFFAPSALLAPIKAFLAQPTSIDYTSLPLLPASTGPPSKAPRSAHSGPLASLPKSTCPICHFRLNSAPIPLDANTASGSAISLPPIQSVFSSEIPEDEAKEETRIFVPAQTDCWGSCRWCYYCIAGKLVNHHVAVKAKRKTGPEEKEEEKWDCLRCDGGITRAWRVGGEI